MNRTARHRFDVPPVFAGRAASSHGGVARTVRAICGLGLLSGLAACAESGQQPTMPATEEAQLYRSHARSHYSEPGPPGDPWRPYIQEAARRFDVPEAWVRAVIHQESGPFGQYALSAPGAMGLMQVMPFTYDEMRVQYGLGEDAYDPHDNIMAGTAYVRQMYDLYGTPGFLAAYNAGPGRLDAFLTRNKPLPAETRHYVALIGPRIAGTYPANRSQTDLMASAAHGGEATYAANSRPVQSNAQTRAVQLAWARHDGGSAADAMPVQVAEAPIAAEPAPHYGSAWQPVGPAAAASGRDAVAAAWAQRQGAAQPAPTSSPAAPVQGPMQGPVQGIVMASNTIQPVRPSYITDTPSADEADDAAPSDAAPRPQMRLASAMLRPTRQHVLAQAGDDDDAPRGRAGAATRGAWAIQVGAFGSQRQASAAAGAARSQAGLDGARAEIDSLRHGRASLYRARLTGLSRDAATKACARMRARGCIVVSPNAS